MRNCLVIAHGIQHNVEVIVFACMVKALKVRTINLGMEPAFRYSVKVFGIDTYTFSFEGRRIGRSVLFTSACFERFGKIGLSAFAIVLAGYIFK